MLNLIQKLHALLVSEEINVWEYPGMKGEPRFYYWLAMEPADSKGHAFGTLEQLIEAAYEHIDPLRKELPEAIVAPPQAEGAV